MSEKLSGIKPWARQLALCSEGLDIIARELPLRGDELDEEEALRLCGYASDIRSQANNLAKSLEEIAQKKKDVVTA
jgi:hypothetical protein